MKLGFLLGLVTLALIFSRPLQGQTEDQGKREDQIRKLEEQLKGLREQKKPGSSTSAPQGKSQPPSSYTSSDAPIGEFSPTKGLLSRWPGNGNCRDVVGCHPGLLENGATFQEGRFGKAFSFTGGGFVRVPSSPDLNPMNGLTVDAWVFPKVDGSFCVIAKWGDEGEWDNQRAYSLTIGTGGTVGFAICNDQRQWDAQFHHCETSPGAIKMKKWNFVAAVYDQRVGSRRIYVNGVQMANRTDPPITLTNSIADLVIGGVLQSPHLQRMNFIGLIEQVEIYNRSLSDLEVRAVFDETKAGARKNIRRNSPAD